MKRDLRLYQYAGYGQLIKNSLITKEFKFSSIEDIIQYIEFNTKRKNKYCEYIQPQYAVIEYFGKKSQDSKIIKLI